MLTRHLHLPSTQTDAVLLLSQNADTSTTDLQMSKPVIVCVPGAFHAPSAWDLVASPLRQNGYQVLTPSLATCTTVERSQDIVGKTTLDDVSIIYEQLLPLLNQGAEALLVSHSYGSVSATLAVEGQTVEERRARGLRGGIMGLVVIAGFAFPVHGKSVMGDDSDPPVPEYFTVKVHHLRAHQVHQS